MCTGVAAEIRFGVFKITVGQDKGCIELVARETFHAVVDDDVSEAACPDPSASDLRLAVITEGGLPLTIKGVVCHIAADALAERKGPATTTECV